MELRMPDFAPTVSEGGFCVQPTARAWYADSWGAIDDAPADAFEEAVGVLEDLYAAVEGFRDARRCLLDVAHVRGGTDLLELGCGTMPQLADTVARVGRDGRIVGFDYTERFLQIARERARTMGIDRVAFQQGDCRELPFDRGTFGAVLADKLLIHVGPGEAIVAEMLRVTKPGGWIGALDWDGEAVMIAADDPSLSRRILDANRDQRACFDAARRAAGWFARAGATEISVAGVLACLTDSARPLMQSLTRRWAHRAVVAGAVQPHEAAAWLADVTDSHRPGVLLAIPIVVTAGRKPDGGMIR
jgi:ubiquinone/menaquinone biosynthesis C-methylase UbiE